MCCFSTCWYFFALNKTNVNSHAPFGKYSLTSIERKTHRLWSLSAPTRPLKVTVDVWIIIPITLSEPHNELINNFDENRLRSAQCSSEKIVFVELAAWMQWETAYCLSHCLTNSCSVLWFRYCTNLTLRVSVNLTLSPLCRNLSFSVSSRWVSAHFWLISGRNLCMKKFLAYHPPTGLVLFHTARLFSSAHAGDGY